MNQIIGEKYESGSEMINDLALLFKMFSDQTRLNIMMCLSETEEANVSSLVEQLGMTQSAVSHQLTILRNSKLIKARREGKSMYYSLADAHVEDILRIGMEHVNE